jgi:dihydroorotate dehydrogenase (fumarate)
MAPPQLSFHPPLLNSASPWATTASNLRALLLCPSTGAITTRTSLLAGFPHDDALHRYLFFDPATALPAPGTSSGPETPHSPPTASATASLNSLGYSPTPLHEYLDILAQLSADLPHIRKLVVISVTGTAEQVRACYDAVAQAASSPSSSSSSSSPYHIKPIHFPLALEINLSCPNIPDKPPPAYSAPALASYLSLLPEQPALPIGVKTPPYTYDAQFVDLVSMLRGAASRISFVTATNTLGSCLVLREHDDAQSTVPQLPGAGFGGMAGPPLHPLALGNVAKIRALLDTHPKLSHVRIIGVGGVSDAQGYKRFRSAGAYAVAVGTALGRHGVEVFGRIEKDLGSSW